MNMTKRMTVGFIVSGIMDDFIERLCHGVMDKAALFGMNLVVIPVKYIDRDINSTPDKYEYQYKTNAKNITDSNLDGLIVAADCVGCLTNQANLNKFLYDLPDVPTVLVASQIEGFICANFDNILRARWGFVNSVCFVALIIMQIREKDLRFLWRLWRNIT